MPHLHEMDFAAFVKRWSDEGHQKGTTKAGMGESMDDAGDGGKGGSREAASLVVKRHLEKKTRASLFMKRKLKCVKSKPRFELRAQSTNNGALPALSIKAALRAQSKPRCAINQKPRFARNQKRASRNQSHAARVIKGALRAAVNYTSFFVFSRFACNQYFSRLARLIKAALRAVIKG